VSGRPVIDAAFPSRCGWCDQRIEEGDRIALLEPDGEWVHEGCAEEEPWPEDENG